LLVVQRVTAESSPLGAAAAGGCATTAPSGLVTVSTERRTARRAPLGLAALAGSLAELVTVVVLPRFRSTRLWGAVPAGRLAPHGFDRFA
jgi:hypothetical protein